MKRTRTLCAALAAAGLALLIGAARQVSGQDTSLAAGPWVGEAGYTVEDTRQTAALQFTVSPAGQVTDGSIRLVFTYPDIPAGVLSAMKEHGCQVTFSELSATSRPVAGLFASAQEAAGVFNAPNCQIEGVGTLEFVTALTGTWSAMPQSAAGEVASAGGGLEGVSPNDPPTHENDGLDGRALYKLHCDECHAQKGLGSEKAPPLEGLKAQVIADKVRQGQEIMEAYSHGDIPDRQLNLLIDYVLRFHPDSTPRATFIITPPD